MPDDRRHVPEPRQMPEGNAPYPLSGDVLVRAVRSLTALQGAGYDQASAKQNQFGLDQKVGFQASILNADAAPFRGNGHSFRASATTPALAALNSFLFIYVPPDATNFIAVLDEVKILLNTAGGAITVYAVGAQGTAAILAANLAQAVPAVDVENSRYGGANGVLVADGYGGAAITTPASAVQIDQYPQVAAGGLPCIASYGDIAIYPGCGILAVAAVAVQPFTFAVTGRVWRLGQGALQNF